MGYESYHAIGKGVITPRGDNVVVLFVTRVKQASLTQYDDFVSGKFLFWEGEEKHRSDDRVASAESAGDEIHLFYREIHHTPFEYRGRVHLLSFIQETDRPSRFVFRLEHDLGPADDLERFRAQVDALPTETEREEVRKARIGQGRFRQQLLKMWEGRCSVTGVRLPPVLTAAHIKPWRSATNPNGPTRTTDCCCSRNTIGSLIAGTSPSTRTVVSSSRMSSRRSWFPRSAFGTGLASVRPRPAPTVLRVPPAGRVHHRRHGKERSRPDVADRAHPTVSRTAIGPDRRGGSG